MLGIKNLGPLELDPHWQWFSEHVHGGLYTCRKLFSWSNTRFLSQTFTHFFLKRYFFLSYITSRLQFTLHLLLPLLAFPFPQIHSSSVSFQKRAGLPPRDISQTRPAPDKTRQPFEASRQGLSPCFFLCLDQCFSLEEITIKFLLRRGGREEAEVWRRAQLTGRHVHCCPCRWLKLWLLLPK